MHRMVARWSIMMRWSMRSVWSMVMPVMSVVMSRWAMMFIALVWWSKGKVIRSQKRDMSVFIPNRVLER